ncbi:MAG: flagellar motor switch protein FliN [Halocynthiibacter sp.]
MSNEEEDHEETISVLEENEKNQDAKLEGLALEEMEAPSNSAPDMAAEKSASDLEAVFDVPVRISVVLGRARIPVADLLKMDVGTVVELDRQVGEAVDIYVNDRLVARGEIVLVENRLGVTMTEIIKAA